VPTRRIFELILITVVLWDAGKVTARIWTRNTWSNTRPGSVTHEAADIVAAIV
jgi:hypothetical protein